MAHLVMDTLTLHELELKIPAHKIAERLPEWIALVVTTNTRSEHIKGMLCFCGMELIDYDTAVVQKSAKGDVTVVVRSTQWMLRQPT